MNELSKTCFDILKYRTNELPGDINWTWGAQRIWDPEAKRFIGKVDMHLPDAWGYIDFAPGDGSTHGDVIPDEGRRDPAWPARLAAMNVYYAQKRYKQLNGVYADNLSQLDGLVNGEILKPFSGSVAILASKDKRKYTASVTSSDGTKAVVTDERLLTVHQSATEES